MTCVRESQRVIDEVEWWTPVRGFTVLRRGHVPSVRAKISLCAEYYSRVVSGETSAHGEKVIDIISYVLNYKPIQLVRVCLIPWANN